MFVILSLLYQYTQPYSVLVPKYVGAHREPAADIEIVLRSLSHSVQGQSNGKCRISMPLLSGTNHSRRRAAAVLEVKAAPQPRR